MSSSREQVTLASGSAGKRKGRARTRIDGATQTRGLNRLKDDVYREMLLVEANRPGAEMGLALALLHAVVQSARRGDPEEFCQWLKDVCPLGLQMIEASLASRCDCSASLERDTKGSA